MLEARPPYRVLVWLGAALLLGCGARAAWAQEVELGLTAAQRCLTPGAQQRGLPTYPEASYKLGVDGRVLVELVFGTRDEPPEATVLESEGGPEFVDSVLAYVRRLHTPCLADAEITSRLVQEYVFKNQRVDWSRNTDPDAARRKQMLRCLTRMDGTTAPEYPLDARRAGIAGRVIVQMIFTAPDQPPQARGFAAPGRSPLAVESVDWSKGYRMPCLRGGPVSADQEMVYLFDGDPRYGFKHLTFAGYVAAMAGLDSQRIQFDTRTMGCPFEARMQYRQPLLPNKVGEVGEHNPARSALFEWLAGSELRLSRNELGAVFGDTIVLDIPCAQVDIKPKE